MSNCTFGETGGRFLGSARRLNSAKHRPCPGAAAQSKVSGADPVLVTELAAHVGGSWGRAPLPSALEIRIDGAPPASDGAPPASNDNTQTQGAGGQGGGGGGGDARK